MKGQAAVETARFDRLARALGAAPSRRDVARVVTGFALGGAVLTAGSPEAAAKKCGPCRKKKKGKCKKKRPNDTACDETGKCLNGTCNQPPDCLPAFAIACLNDASCCSDVCQGMFPNSQCGKGAKGTECFVDNDCTSNNCLGFRCQ